MSLACSFVAPGGHFRNHGIQFFGNPRGRGDDLVEIKSVSRVDKP